MGMLRPLTARMLPRFVTPINDEQKQARGQVLMSSMMERGGFEHILLRFDANDFNQFNRLLSFSAASVGVVDPETKSLHPTKVMRTMLAKHSNITPDGAGGGRAGSND